jgi:hypothetical protein
MNESTKPSLGDKEARLARVSGWLEHENQLVSHRMGWMLTLQGLLFAAVAFFTKGGSNAFPILVICGVGIVSCVSITHAIHGSCRILDILNQERRSLVHDMDVESGFEPIPVFPKRRLNFLYPWRILPTTLCVAWFVLAFYFAFS